MIAEAKVVTSAVLLKKLKERLKNTSSFNLSEEQLDEAYKVMEDLNRRVDEVEPKCNLLFDDPNNFIANDIRYCL